MTKPIEVIRGALMDACWSMNDPTKQREALSELDRIGAVLDGLLKHYLKYGDNAQGRSYAAGYNDAIDQVKESLGVKNEIRN